MENNIAGTVTGTADATGILDVVAKASAQGFLHIMLFIIVIGIMAYIYIDRKDRAKSKDKNESWQDTHMDLHKQLEANYNRDFRRIDENVNKIFNKINDVSDKVSQLSGSFSTFLDFEKNRKSG